MTSFNAGQTDPHSDPCVSRASVTLASHRKNKHKASSASSNSSTVNPWQTAKPRWKQPPAGSSPPSALELTPVVAPLSEQADTTPAIAAESTTASAELLRESLPTLVQDDDLATLSTEAPGAEPVATSIATPETEISQDSQEAESKLESPAEPLIENLEQFIAHAYTLKKTQKLTLDAKTADVIKGKTILDTDALQRLQRLAQQDRLLATPRQLLRVVRSAATTEPALRNAIREFVRNALLAHRLFHELNLVGCIRNQPGAADLASALSLIAKSSLESVLPPDEDGEIPDKKVFDELRLNAIRTLALWMTEVQHTPSSSLAEAFYYTLWQPAAEGGRSVDEHQILTEIKDFQSVGLACRSFVKTAEEQAKAAQAAVFQTRRAQEETNMLREELNQSRTSLLALEQRLTEVEGQLQDQQAAYQTLDLHLRDQLENLRTRVLRRLKDDERLLSEGLIALRRPTPKVHVMDDHAERVLDSLQSEIKKLEKGG